MTDKPTVVEAITKVMEEVQAIGKGDRNEDQGYAFRGVDAVINAVGPILRKHGVLLMPVGVEASYRDVQTSRGKPSRECTVKARYRWYGPAGDSIDAEVPGEAMDFGDKGTPKAMSIAYRILLLQGLCIPTGEPEPDASTYERDAAEPRPAVETFVAQVLGNADPDDIARVYKEAARFHMLGTQILDPETQQETTLGDFIIGCGREARAKLAPKTDEAKEAEQPQLETAGT